MNHIGGLRSAEKNQKENKRQIVRPEISPDTPHLWFEIDKFCILCGVVSITDTATSSKQMTYSSTSPDPSLQEENAKNFQYRNPVTIPLAEMSKTPSLEEYGTIERSGSFASPTPAISSAEMLTTPAQHSEIESKCGHHVNTERRATTKRKLSLSSSVESKRPPCYIEYMILFVHIKSTLVHKFYLFVCQNCLTSIQVIFLIVNIIIAILLSCIGMQGASSYGSWR